MMDERATRAQLIKQMRRALVDMLKLAHPAAMSFQSLLHVLPEIEEAHLRTDVTYLIDKGYVDWINKRPNLTWAERQYRLSAAGVEVADAINVDPALEP